MDTDAVRARYRSISRHKASGELGYVLSLIRVVVDVPTLANEIDRLRDLLTDTRRQHADLLAAVRATLAAVRDAEPDPYWYLLDQIGANTGRGGW